MYYFISFLRDKSKDRRDRFSFADSNELDKFLLESGLEFDPYIKENRDCHYLDDSYFFRAVQLKRQDINTNVEGIVGVIFKKDCDEE